MVLGSFNTASGKYCCNLADLAAMTGAKTSFNTASGKYCCNDTANKALRADRAGFQYRKR